MKKLLISLAITLTAVYLFATSPARADHRIETAEQVVALTVHMDGARRPYVEKFDFGKPVKTVLKPCPDGKQSDCLYVVEKRRKGRRWVEVEKEIFSFTAGDLNWVSYKTEFKL